jgi:AAA15 family ATPase/GTPase
MKLSRVHIGEFQSVRDSNDFQIGNVRCLVGKNETGKTAILKALYWLNPLVETDAIFNATEDYPRASGSAHTVHKPLSDSRPEKSIFLGL